MCSEIPILFLVHFQYFLERKTFYKTIILSSRLVVRNTIHHVCESAPLIFSHSIPGDFLDQFHI